MSVDLLANTNSGIYAIYPEKEHTNNRKTQKLKSLKHMLE